MKRGRGTVSGGSHLDSTPCWPKANTPGVQGSHCGMILRYEFWEACFLEGWLCAKPSAGCLTHTIIFMSVLTLSTHPARELCSDWGGDTCHQNGEFNAKAECLFAEMGQDVPVRNLRISKFGLPGSLLEVTRNSLTICWKNFPALALPEDFWMKCIFTGVIADTRLAFSDSENRHKKRK